MRYHVGSAEVPPRIDSYGEGSSIQQPPEMIDVSISSMQSLQWRSTAFAQRFLKNAGVCIPCVRQSERVISRRPGLVTGAFSGEEGDSRAIAVAAGVVYGLHYDVASKKDLLLTGHSQETIAYYCVAFQGHVISPLKPRYPVKFPVPKVYGAEASNSGVAFDNFWEQR